MLKTTMAYNWTAANTPQGRERLKELMDSGKTIVCKIDGSIREAVQSISINSERCYTIWRVHILESDWNLTLAIDLLNRVSFLDPSPEPHSADTKDLMELGKSIAKTQELLMGMNEPRPSNDLLRQAHGRGAVWNSYECPELSMEDDFAEWIASIDVDPYEETDEDLQSPAWCIDCSKMIPFLEDSFALLGFHPTLGHCVIASNYGFTQVRDGRFSVVSYASEPREFMDSKSAADWCAEEKVWFIPPHGSHRPSTQADPLAADRQVVFDAWDNGYLGISGEDHVAQPILKSLKRLMGVEVDNG